jgi:hypothetical protein
MSDVMAERTTLTYGARCPHRLAEGTPCPGRLVYATTKAVLSSAAVRGRARRLVCNGPDAHEVEGDPLPPDADDLSQTSRAPQPRF